MYFSEVRNKEQILAEIQMTAAAVPVNIPVKSETVEETVEVLVADDDFMEAAVNSLQFELLECERRGKLFNARHLVSRMPKL